MSAVELVAVDAFAKVAAFKRTLEESWVGILSMIDVVDALVMAAVVVETEFGILFMIWMACFCIKLELSLSTRFPAMLRFLSPAIMNTPWVPMLIRVGREFGNTFLSGSG